MNITADTMVRDLPPEKEKLEQVFASAPPWLIWFTFADYTAELLGLSLPDLSSVAGDARQLSRPRARIRRA